MESRANLKIWLAMSALLVTFLCASAPARIIYVDAHTSANSQYVRLQTIVENQAIIIDHNCVDLSAIPDDYIAGAASLRVLMRHASVGQGIDWGLECLAGNRPTNADCSGFAAGTYDRSNWVFELRGGNWQAKVDDLVSQVALRADDFDVFMTKLCYIDALGSKHPDWEYFRSRMEQLEADYPDKEFVWWTIPLTRDGQPGTDVFNALIRSYCAVNNKILFDIADIECHDPNGTKLTNAAGDEVISQNYTKEIHAGHLNIPGRVRVASAFWHLMARLAGWQKKYDTIQAAIDDANDGDVIIVKPGTYTGPGNRDIDFLGKAITVRSTDPNDPNIVAATIIDCNGTEAEPHRGFKFHSGEDASSVVEGFTVTNGYGFPDPNLGWSLGGGIYCSHSGPTIINCVITANRAAQGAGIFAWENSSPKIANCAVTENSGIIAGGGGIYSWENSVLTVTDCTISSNQGRGVHSWDSSASVVKCVIANNTMYGIDSLGEGALTVSHCAISDNLESGIHSIVHSGGTATISNCIISGNNATFEGGGIRAITFDDAILTIGNCTITGNSAVDHFGHLGQGGGICCSKGSTIITNSIVRNNRGEDLYVWNYPPPPGDDWMEPTRLVISYSCIGEILVENDPIIGDPVLIWGGGNIDADPCFAKAGYWDANDDSWADGDYHLKSEAARWDPNSQSWVKDDVTSPCIDAGHPSTPIGDEPFPNGGIINMGAYGGTAEASKSYFGKPVCETVIAGDINGDCKVDFADFQFIALHWLEKGW